MTGESQFNEVFLTDARMPGHHLVGERNDGWRVLRTALGFERLVMGSTGTRSRDDRRLPVGGSIDLFDLAARVGRDRDPLVRQALVELYILRTVIGWNARRAAAIAQRGGFSPAASLGKLAMSRLLHESAGLADRLLGMAGTLYGEQVPDAHSANHALMMAFMNSIGGGSDQIQRNIIAERILGLPKDISVDHDQPFREVPKAAALRPAPGSLAPAILERTWPTSKARSSATARTRSGASGTRRSARRSALGPRPPWPRRPTVPRTPPRCSGWRSSGSTRLPVAA